MADTIVFFGKYSTLVGKASPGQDYPSDPYDVTSFKTVVVEALLLQVAASATASVQMQQSSDLQDWANVGSAMSLTAGTISTAVLSDTARYIRAVVTVVVADGVATLWVKAVCRDA